MLTPGLKQKIAAAYLKRVLDNILPDHSEIHDLAGEMDAQLSQNECRDVAARIIYLSDLAYRLVKNKRK
jgi:hypothetical protein